MRRLRILFYWLFYSKNNVGAAELIKFLFKPTVDVIAKRYIESIDHGQFFKVKFREIEDVLYWPSVFPINGINQITAETFDSSDWHYYQKSHTIIEAGEYLLDIGTAEGLFPLSVISKCNHVYLIEPSKSFGLSLQKTFAAYIDKVTIFHTAIGNIEGEIGFDENSLIGQVSVDANDRIPITTIDALLGPDSIITYLKADIEGFEFEMLQGAEMTIKRNKPKIAITTYHRENNYNEIIALLTSYVPEYKYFIKGIHEEEPKPVMVHLWT